MAPRSARVHPQVRGFDRAAATYERGRPDYPAAAVRALGRALRLGPGRTVVEVGSGTGKFTRALKPLGSAIVAVEPTRGMREIFHRAVPDVPVLDGTAEDLPLPYRFADAIVAAQAFHWFRYRPALREFARVLRPGGGIGLVWNIREQTAPWSRAVTKILDRYGWRGVPRTRDQRWKRVFTPASGPFGPLHERKFRYAQRLTREGFVDRVLSVSFIASRTAAEQRRLAQEVRELLRNDPRTRGRATVTLTYRTEVYWAFLK
jgi:SAM-dependent methyltransferase